MQDSQRKTCHGFVLAVAIVLLFDAIHLNAQQSMIPHEIIKADTTFVGSVDSGLIDVLIKELPDQGPDTKGTVLENRLIKTKKILAGKTVWLTANWPSIPTKIEISIAEPDGTCISGLTKLWNIRSSKLVSNQRCSVSLNSIGKAEKPSDNDKLVDKWQQVLTDAPENPIRFGMHPPKHLYTTIDEILTELPDYLGGGPVKLLTEGALSGSVSVNPANRSIDGFIQSKNVEAAQQLKNHLPKLFTSAIKSLSNKADQPMANVLQRIVKETSFRVEQNRVRVQFEPKDEAAATELTQQAMNVFLGPIAQQSHLEKLRNAALGILNYESAYRYFPPPADSRGVDGPTGLSWRVHILPFLGEYELWQEFKMDEPWDSPANKKLLPKMPAIYSRFSSQLLMPSDAPKGMTTLMAPVSDKTILGAPNRVSFGNISDGSSNTILLVMVKDSMAVPWTAPQDYKFDPADPAKDLQFDNDKASIVMCDGSTYAAARDNQWQHLFEMNDNNVIQLKVE